MSDLYSESMADIVRSFVRQLTPAEAHTRLFSASELAKGAMLDYYNALDEANEATGDYWREYQHGQAMKYLAKWVGLATLEAALVEAEG